MGAREGFGDQGCPPPMGPSWVRVAPRLSDHPEMSSILFMFRDDVLITRNEIKVIVLINEDAVGSDRELFLPRVDRVSIGVEDGYRPVVSIKDVNLVGRVRRDRGVTELPPVRPHSP